MTTQFSAAVAACVIWTTSSARIDGSRALDLEIRAGLHAGMIELR